MNTKANHPPLHQCAHCERFRNPRGELVFSPLFAAVNREVRCYPVTRGICPECAEFLLQLYHEVRDHWLSCLHTGMVPVVRLNGTSDLPWESFKIPCHNSDLFELCPGVQFYDYTKNPKRAADSLREGWPTNYRLVLSRSEKNLLECTRHLLDGGNVAMVFDTKRKQELPQFWSPGHCWNPAGGSPDEFPVIDGDKDDLRFLDPSPCIVGLRAKGPAVHDKSGFVIR